MPRKIFDVVNELCNSVFQIDRQSVSYAAWQSRQLIKAIEIFHKTAKGQSEIESKTNALTLIQRRVLILVNGENDAATLEEYSRCDNVAEILEFLMSLGFVDHGGSTGSSYDFAHRKTKRKP